MYSVYYKKTAHSASILPSKFEIRYSIFCGSLFNPAAKAASVIIKTVPFWRSFTREECAEQILQLDTQMIVLGSGDPGYHLLSKNG